MANCQILGKVCRKSRLEASYVKRARFIIRLVVVLSVQLSVRKVRRMKGVGEERR